MKSPRGQRNKFSVQGSSAKSASAIGTPSFQDALKARSRNPEVGWQVVESCRDSGFIAARCPGTTCRVAAGLSLRAGLLGRALRGFGELGGDSGGFRRTSPARRLAAIAPGARAIEGVDAELVHLLHFT